MGLAKRVHTRIQVIKPGLSGPFAGPLHAFDRSGISPPLIVQTRLGQQRRNEPVIEAVDLCQQLFGLVDPADAQQEFGQFGGIGVGGFDLA
jgi:hypothetical protein